MVKWVVGSPTPMYLRSRARVRSPDARGYHRVTKGKVHSLHGSGSVDVPPSLALSHQRVISELGWVVEGWASVVGRGRMGSGFCHF